MTIFGDTEPEDAWHPDDPPIVQLRNLSRRLELLGYPLTRSGNVTIRQLIDDLAYQLGQARRDRTLDARARLRVRQTGDDLSYVSKRVRRG